MQVQEAMVHVDYFNGEINHSQNRYPLWPV